jgi:thioredoxin-related protein
MANDNGRGGVHTLAYSLLDGNMGYPAMVYLNEKFERIMISPGYKEVPDMLKELKFAAEEQYSKTTWEAYKAAN